jgi:tetratricopeptide (TPR) repeat protein
MTLSAATLLSGCGPGQKYYRMRFEGQKAMLEDMYGTACYFYKEAERSYPRTLENLHDLGVCSVMLARQKFEAGNRAAALRELDAAISYYSEAIEVYPAYQAALEGKSVALKLKGQFDEALKHAEWAAQFVGPSAKQYIFLADELEKRGDIDGAQLRYRQAVAIEPSNARVHRAFAEFLLRQGNERPAVYHLQAAYKLDPLDEWVIDELTKRSALPALTSEQERER